MSLYAYGRTSEPPESGPLSSRLSREQLLDRIMTLNPSATSEFLSRFGDQDLDQYLTRLSGSRDRLGRQEGAAPLARGRSAGG